MCESASALLLRLGSYIRLYHIELGMKKLKNQSAARSSVKLSARMLPFATERGGNEGAMLYESGRTTAS